MEINQELWNEFLKGDIVVNCKTEEEAREFVNYCNKQGIRWISEDDDIRWDFEENTCYINFFKDLTIGSKIYCENHNFTIITYQLLITPIEKNDPEKEYTWDDILNIIYKNVSINMPMPEEIKKTYKGWEILKMIDEKLLKEGDTYTRLKTKNHNGDIISESTFIVGDSVEPNLISIKEDTFTIEIKEKEYLDLEGAMSIAGLEGLNLKHKDWDNYVPKEDVMINIMDLIQNRRFKVEDLVNKVWEVEE